MVNKFTWVLSAILIAAFVVFLLAISTAKGQTMPPPCAPRADMLKHLSDKYKELPREMGVTLSGGLMELLISDDKSTWTLLITSPDKITCLLAAGENWRGVRSLSLEPGV